MWRILPPKFCFLCLVVFLLPVALRAREQRWVSVSSPYFTVLTPESEKVARVWAAELERFRLMLQQVLVAPDKRLRPVTVVLFSSDRAMKPFKPLEKGKPQKVDGLFVNFGDSHAIELSLESTPVQIRRIIFHEAVHWYSNASEMAMPLWLEEGVAEVYSTFQVKPDGTCSFGHTINEHIAALQGLPRWSMEKLALTARDSLQYNEGDRATQFYAEAWLATHYLLFGKDTPGRTSLARYLEALGTADSSAQAFQQAFGVDYAGFNRRLGAYVKGGHYSIYSYRQPADDIDKKLVVKPASEAAVQLALGTLLLGARQQATPESEAYLRRAAALAPQDPVVWQVLGEGAMLGKQLDEAEKYFAQAVASGSDSYYTHYCLGYCRLRGVDWNNGLVDTAATLASVRDFRRALSLNPRFVPAYEALAGLMYAVESYEPKDRELLEQGIRLAPENGMVDVGLAACDLKAGRREAGRQRLGLVLQTTRGVGPEARSLAEGILQSDDWNAMMEELNGLFESRRFAEAITLIDAARDKFPEPKFRSILRQNRQNAENAVRINRAIDLANNGEVQAAKDLLEQMTAAEVNPQARAEARRLLDDIAKSELRAAGRR